MTYRILEFNVTLFGAKNVGKDALFPKEEGAKHSVRHEIISEVEASVDIILHNFDLPDGEHETEQHAWQSDGMIGVFDVASKESFETLKDFLVLSESEPEIRDNFLILGFDRGSSPQEIDNEDVVAVINAAEATYLEVSPDFVKDLDIIMRRFASSLIQQSEG
ncbi:MAG: hypothetical protein ACXAEF_04065 [Candidatus Thorarchaeota archaeon]|jgi:hypothetical protein